MLPDAVDEVGAGIVIVCAGIETGTAIVCAGSVPCAGIAIGAMTVCAGIVTVVCAATNGAKSSPKRQDSVFIGSSLSGFTKHSPVPGLYKCEGSGNPQELLEYASPSCICIFFAEAIA
jgi:hypothetical protein